MKTAVEWLFKWMIDNKDSIIEERLQAFEQAKEMEKEQSINFAYEIADDLAHGVYSKKAIEDLFNETFKSE
jgi:transcription termination factor NusB